MERILSDHERSRLDERIAEAEKRTKAQIVLAVIKRSDAYAELPWKAFALGASIAGLLVFILDLLFYYWISHAMALVAVGVTLAAGAALALLTVFVPGFARLFLSAHRAELEVRQYAESLFLAREIFATGGRTGILLLVSLFERQVILLPDKGLNDILLRNAMDDVITPMIPSLTRNKICRALEDGLERLTQVLEDVAVDGTAGTDEKDLSDEIIEEKGV